MTDNVTTEDPDKSVRESMLTYYSEHPDLDTDGVFSLVYTLPPAKLRSVILEFYGAFTTLVADEGEREIAYGILRRYQRNAGLTKLAGLN